MANFSAYRIFPSAQAAADLVSLLTANGIRYEVADSQLDFDVTFARNAAMGRYEVRLQPPDFEAARQLEAQANREALTQADPEHYLFSFADEELFDVVAKPDEWSSFDVILAGQILRERGRDVSPDAVELLRRHRNAELAKPEESQKAWLWFGYLAAVLGGLFAPFIGWHLYSHKKSLPNGQRVLAFSPGDRVHGLRILVLGLLFVSLWVALRLLHD